jgi:predicted CxxxxCH...CXXCH cytochrome family protein
LVFGALASQGDRRPQYDSVARTCADSWCHRESADAVWTEPRSSQAACGTCHGLPPALPHPQSQNCQACHGQVIDAERKFVEPALHVDGTIQVQSAECSACHGAGNESAPPNDTHGNETRNTLGVGAHRAHLDGGAFSRPLACAECHSVPLVADERGHADGLPAQVSLTGVAESAGRSPNWRREIASCADTWCHGPSPSEANHSPSWVATEPLTCIACHAVPPPAPHPQLDDCSRCHGAVVGSDDVTIIDRERHVDGVVDVDLDPDCTSCHGADNPAPPVDVSGQSASTFAGVGAHQAHLGAGGRARPVACAECHAVPAELLDPGHIDSALPAEVAFTGVATAFGAAPVYENGTCRETACHGGVFPNNHRSGGTTLAPRWTQVDGSQASCGACHGLPPPRPHPYTSNCSQCHENVAADNVSFVRPELHVDGVVTFTIP